MGKALILALFLYLLPPSLLAQEGRALLPSPERRLELARSSPDYPVTPGDSYQLYYTNPYGGQSLEIQIRSDYMAYLGLFGQLNAKGLTALKFIQAVEELVRKAYPQSRPNCFIKTTGVFSVMLCGEVDKSGLCEAWGLLTLEELIRDRLTAQASLRTIEIHRDNQQILTCDLFQALRNGKREENPYLRPGDLVNVKKAQLQIKVLGEVVYPGKYEILPGETLRDACEVYAGGLTAAADKERIYLWRNLNASTFPGKAFIFTSTSTAYSDFRLENLDYIQVTSVSEKLPVVYFEGALVSPTQPQEQTAIVVSSEKPDSKSTLFTLRIYEGQTLAAALHEVKELLSPLADLKNAMLLRTDKNEAQSLNLAELLYSFDASKDLVLRPGDRIIIPQLDYYVTVAGAVIKPGRYPWQSNQTYQYYVNQAGGCDPQKNLNNSVTIYDAYHNRLESAQSIPPGASIIAEYNNSLYHLAQWVPVFSLALSTASLIVAIWQLLR